jgi:hypothetical protein
MDCRRCFAGKVVQEEGYTGEGLDRRKMNLLECGLLGEEFTLGYGKLSPLVKNFAGLGTESALKTL